VIGTGTEIKVQSQGSSDNSGNCDEDDNSNGNFLFYGHFGLDRAIDKFVVADDSLSVLAVLNFLH
jgi:hypothetical protein